MRTLLSTALLTLFAWPIASSAQSAPGYGIPAYVSRVDGDARLERGAMSDATASLERNLTLIQGDRVSTGSGRVEIAFREGLLLHLDRHTTVDFLEDEYIRVMDGRVRWAIPREWNAALRLDTPSATIEMDPGGEYRVTVAPNGDAELVVLHGSGAIFNHAGDTALRAGERAISVVGRPPSQAYYANSAAWDEFDRWSDRQQRARAATVSLRYLPGELRPYGRVFDDHGSWRAHPSYGYVWYPTASADWQPYAHGRWASYPRYGWTWIGADPWAWPTHHFGRWGFTSGTWFWIPDRAWAPAWVAWASSPGYVGWSPLGWDNRPILSFTTINVYNRATSGYPWCGWTFIREQQFGDRWRPGQAYVGVSIGTIANQGIREGVGMPRVGDGGFAVPRTGNTGRTAVPRVAAPRTSTPIDSTNDVMRGREVGERGIGLGRVPPARTPHVPAGPIRSGVGEGRAVPRQPTTRERVPSAESSSGVVRPRRESAATTPTRGRAIERPSVQELSRPSNTDRRTARPYEGAPAPVPARGADPRQPREPGISVGARSGDARPAPRSRPVAPDETPGAWSYPRRAVERAPFPPPPDAGESRPRVPPAIGTGERASQPRGRVPSLTPGSRDAGAAAGQSGPTGPPRVRPRDGVAPAATAPSPASSRPRPRPKPTGGGDGGLQ